MTRHAKQWSWLVAFWLGCTLFGADTAAAGQPAADRMAWLRDHGYQGRYFLFHSAYSAEWIDKWHTLGAGFFDFVPPAKAKDPAAATGAMLERCRAHNAYGAVYLTHGRPIQPGHPAQLDPAPTLPRQQYWELAQRNPGTMLLMVDEIANGAWSYASRPVEPATRLGREALLVENLRKLWDYWTPPAAIGRATWENCLTPVYHYEAGTDLCILELYRGQNLQIETSRLRGTTRAYPDKFYGVSLTERSWLSSYLSWTRMQGLTSNPGTVGGSPNSRSLLTTYCLDDVVKGYYYFYFNGATMIGHEAGPPSQEEVERLVAFLKTHPRIDFPDARLAIVEGLGCSTGTIPRPDDARTGAHWSVPPMDLFASRSPPSQTSTWGGVSEWGDHTHIRDLDLYAVVFPECGNAAVRRQYTGTPLGPVDIIPATVSSEGLRRYKVLWFLSMNVMTHELAGRLRRYVREGGMLLMNVEQLRGDGEQWNGLSKSLLAELFGVELAGDEPSDEAEAEVSFVAAEPFGFPRGTKHPAPYLRLYPARLAEGRAVAATRAGQPVCVIRQHGKGDALLTLTQWPWRLPWPRLVDLSGCLARSAGTLLELTPADRFMEPLVCPLHDRSGVAVALFNHQVDHLDEPYYRKLYQTVERPLGKIGNQVLDVDLSQQQTVKFRWDFPATDLAAYDEIRFRLRADGEKPGGGLYLTFVDTQGKKASLPRGLIKVSWLDWPQPYTKYISPIDLEVAGVKWIRQPGFDWQKVVGMELTANRQANGPIRYRLHIVDVSQVSMMVDGKRTHVRKNIPYRGQARLDLDLLCLNLPDCKVYRADTQMNLTPIAAQRQGQVLTFPVEVESDWAEFLVQ